MIRQAALAFSVLVLTSCSGSAPTPTSPANVMAVTNDERSTGAAFFSDDEYARLKLRVVNLDDLDRFPVSTKLAPFVKVQVLKTEQVDLRAAGSTSTIPMYFDRVRVLDGPVKDREGWVSGLVLH